MHFVQRCWSFKKPWTFILQERSSSFLTSKIPSVEENSKSTTERGRVSKLGEAVTQIHTEMQLWQKVEQCSVRKRIVLKKQRIFWFSRDVFK